MIEIKAPKLNSTEYGKNIAEIMSNIDANFNELREGGFNKGEQGDSVKVVVMDLKTRPDIIESIKAVLNTEFELNNNVPRDINGVTVFDYLNEPGNMTFIYKDNDDSPLSSLPYVFKDLRFEQLKFMENETMVESFEQEIDWSCVIYYENGEYKITQEFPTLYYDNGFKWKINGIKTGLYAQGPQGLKGESGDVTIVGVPHETGPSYKIQYIYVGDTPVDVTSSGSDHKTICEQNGVSVNSSVIALVWNKDTFEIDSYACSVYELNGSMMVNCFDKSYEDLSNNILAVSPITSTEIQKLWDEVIGENAEEQ